MPRRIISQDPIVIPAVPEQTLNDVAMTKFVVFREEDGNKARITMSASNYDTGEYDQSQSYTMSLKDWDNQITQSPKLQRAWDDINDVMGLAYDFFRLRDKVNEALANGEDATALIAARDAALVALRAPLT